MEPLNRINEDIHMNDVVERRHARAPQIPAGKVETKLDRFAERFDAWMTKMADKLFGPNVAEKIVGPHARRS